MQSLQTSYKQFLIVVTVFLLAACEAQQTHQAVETHKVASSGTQYNGVKVPMLVGSFENKSGYLQGLFSDGGDRLGDQARTILRAHLQQSNRFRVVDRENLEDNKREAQLAGVQQKITGARLTLTGAVSEFGRKATGDKQLFGVLGSGKKQIAYAKITLNIVDVASSEIIYSVQGAGEYALSNREVIGFGSTASYDATLNGKVLDFAITEAINKLVSDLDGGVWSVSAR